MSFRELAPSSKRLSLTSMRLPPSAVSQMVRSFSSITLREALRGPLRLAQRRQRFQLRVELAVDITLLEQVPLDLAAGRLWNALDRHYFRDLEPGLLVDEPGHLGGERQEILHRAAVQDEEHQLLDLGARRPTPAATTLPSSRPPIRCAIASRSCG